MGLQTTETDRWSAGQSPAPLDASWVFSTVLKGCRLQFAVKPSKFNEMVVSIANGDGARILLDKITLMLETGAIKVVPPGEVHTGFYSPYFLKSKERGLSLRPTLDLQVLNKLVRKYTFRILTHKVLCRFICPSNWFISIDVADAYFHISIQPLYRRFLKFACVVYGYRAILFGLLFVARVLSKCVEAALSPLWSSGTRIRTYVDNFPKCSQSRDQAIKKSSMVMNHLSTSCAVHGVPPALRHSVRDANSIFYCEPHVSVWCTLFPPREH